MKKLFFILIALVTISIAAASCGGNKNGVGCPTGNPNKPFRA